MALSNGQVQEIQRILSERQLEAHRRYLEKKRRDFPEASGTGRAGGEG